jgi:hypothetical protein
VRAFDMKTGDKKWEYKLKTSDWMGAVIPRAGNDIQPRPGSDPCDVNAFKQVDAGYDRSRR